MKGLTRSQLHQIKEAFDIASFSKKWWKMLSKEIRQTEISNYQKTQVYLKIMEGLLNECLEINHDDDEIIDIYDVMLVFAHKVEVHKNGE